MTEQADELRRKIWPALIQARRKAVVEIARALEYASLIPSVLPDDLFSIYIDILSDAALCSRPGVDEFVSGLFNDFGKLSSKQKDDLLHLFLENGSRFSLPFLRIAVSDFIARKYPRNVSIELFLKMWVTEDENLRDMAYSGVQVISRLLPQQGEERAAIRKLGELMMEGSSPRPVRSAMSKRP